MSETPSNVAPNGGAIAAGAPTGLASQAESAREAEARGSAAGLDDPKGDRPW